MGVGCGMTARVSQSLIHHDYLRLARLFQAVMVPSFMVLACRITFELLADKDLREHLWHVNP
jgi:hypothetical protein